MARPKNPLEPLNRDAAFEHLNRDKIISLIQERCMPLPEQLDTIMVEVADLQKRFRIAEKHIRELETIFHPTTFSPLANDTVNRYLTSPESYSPQNLFSHYYESREKKRATQRAANSEDFINKGGDDNFYFIALMVVVGKLIILCNEVKDIKKGVGVIQSQVGQLTKQLSSDKI